MQFGRLDIFLVLSVIVLAQGRAESRSDVFVSEEIITIYELETVVMSCSISESDDYVTWRVDNEFHRKQSQHMPGERQITFKGALTRPFELVGRYSVNNDRNYHNLTIAKVNLSEAGNYFCFDQWNTKRQRSIWLHILVSNSTLQNVEYKLVSAGDNVILPCQANSTHGIELQFIASSRAPSMTVWNSNISEERFAGRILKVTHETSEAFNLLIRNVKRDDTGYYVCIESRGGDKMAHGVFLDVYDIQEFASQTPTSNQAFVAFVGVLGTLTGTLSLWIICGKRHRNDAQRVHRDLRSVCRCEGCD